MFQWSIFAFCVLFRRADIHFIQKNEISKYNFFEIMTVKLFGYSNWLPTTKTFTTFIFFLNVYTLFRASVYQMLDNRALYSFVSSSLDISWWQQLSVWNADKITGSLVKTLHLPLANFHIYSISFRLQIRCICRQPINPEISGNTQEFRTRIFRFFPTVHCNMFSVCMVVKVFLW